MPKLSRVHETLATWPCYKAKSKMLSEISMIRERERQKRKGGKWEWRVIVYSRLNILTKKKKVSSTYNLYDLACQIDVFTHPWCNMLCFCETRKFLAHLTWLQNETNFSCPLVWSVKKCMYSVINLLLLLFMEVSCLFVENIDPLLGWTSSLCS